MKSVVKSDMVAHLWAHQSQAWATNPQRNFSFRRKEIKSYSTVIALIEERKGQQIVLYCDRYFSPTTCKHQSAVRRATSHMTTIGVDAFGTPAEYMKDYRKRIAKCMAAYGRARTSKPRYLEQLKTLVKNGNTLAEFFGLKTRFNLPTNKAEMEAECKRLDNIEAKHRRQVNAAAKKRKIAEEKHREEMRQKWLAGEGYHYPDDGEVHLRVVGNELQTSKGVQVPLEHAIKVFAFVKQCREEHKPYQANGHTIHIGHFSIDKVDESGNVTAGCHSIQWTEIERIAKQVGLAA